MSPEAVIRADIARVYQELAERPNALVSLVRLRAKLPGVSHEELSTILKQMDRERLIQLSPDPNRKALPREARQAAVRLGGGDQHFISMG